MFKGSWLEGYGLGSMASGFRDDACPSTKHFYILHPKDIKEEHIISTYADENQKFRKTSNKNGNNTCKSMYKSTSNRVVCNPNDKANHLLNPLNPRLDPQP